MRIDLQAVEEAAKTLYIRALKVLPPDIKSVFGRLQAGETDATASRVLATMVTNIQVAEDTDIPIIIYNVPGRTGVNMLPETVARLSELKNVVGIKEATGSLEQVSRVIECAAEGFIVLSGDDFVTLPLLAVGGHGAISVTSNIVPSDVSAMIERFFSDDLEGARSLHYRLQPINRAMFLETNPIPVKTSLAMMGMIEEEFRLPLVRISDENRTRLLEAMKAYGLAVAGR